MKSPPPGVYTTAKTSPGGEFHAWMAKWYGCEHNEFFLLGRVIWRSSFLSNFKPSNKKHDLRRNSNLRPFVIFSIFSIVPTAASNKIAWSCAGILDEHVHFFTVV